MNPDDLHSRLVSGLHTSETIRAAFADHPRHRFIPDLIWPDIRGLPLYRTANPGRWARVVYGSDEVVTQANDGGSGAVNTATSSSSSPQLRIEDGRRPWDDDHAPVIALSAEDSWVHLWPDSTTTGAGPRDLGKELGEAYVELDAAGWPKLPGFTLDVSPEHHTHTIRTTSLDPWVHSAH